MEESRIDRAKRFARIWWESRAEAGVSQEYMALGIGVSKKTVQNWEKGTSSPSFFQGLEWFKILGLNPLPYYLEFMYPDWDDGNISNDDEGKTTEMLVDVVSHLPNEDKKQLLYFLSGEHGSSPQSVLQLLMAHLHTPMRDRVTTASVVMQNYELARELGTIVKEDKALPREKELKVAIEKGKEATINKKDGYVLGEIRKS